MQTDISGWLTRLTPADIERMIEWKLDGIISDYPDRVLQILKRK